MANRYVALILCALFTFRTFAGACCGGSTSLPTLITGDNRAQYNVTYNNSAVLFDVDSSGATRARNYDSREVNESFTFQASKMLNELWQISLDTKVIQNTKKSSSLQESHTSLGDIGATITFEALPELEFSYWKPRVFVFSKANFTTGQSVYESTSTLRTDISGEGFPSLSAGLVLNKVIGSFDTMAMTEYKALLAQFKDTDNDTSTADQKIQPGSQVKNFITLGYSPPKTAWRLGISWLYNLKLSGKNETLNSVISESQTQQIGFSAAYKFKQNSVSIFFNDQTLLSSKNTSINKSIGISFTHFVSL